MVVLLVGTHSNIWGGGEEKGKLYGFSPKQDLPLQIRNCWLPQGHPPPVQVSQIPSQTHTSTLQNTPFSKTHLIPLQFVQSLHLLFIFKLSPPQKFHFLKTFLFSFLFFFFAKLFISLFPLSIIKSPLKTQQQENKHGTDKDCFPGLGGMLLNTPSNPMPSLKAWMGPPFYLPVGRE